MRVAHDRSDASPQHRRRRLAQTDAGETLMEVLLAIVLMGIGFTAILSGLWTSARVAQINQRTTKASIALQALAEALTQPASASRSSTYIPCAGADGNNVTGDQYKDNMQNTPPIVQQLVSQGWTWRVAKVRYLDKFESISTAEPDIMIPKWRSWNSCTALLPSMGGKDNGLQEITIEVTNGTSVPAADQISQQIVVMKRDRTCPTTFTNADLGPC